MNIKKKYLKLSVIFIPGNCAQYQTSLKLTFTALPLSSSLICNFVSEEENFYNYERLLKYRNTYKLSNNMARIWIPITEEDEGDGDDDDDEEED